MIYTIVILKKYNNLYNLKKQKWYIFRKKYGGINIKT